MKITKRQLGRIIREALISESATTEETDKIAQMWEEGAMRGDTDMLDMVRSLVSTLGVDHPTKSRNDWSIYFVEAEDKADKALTYGDWHGIAVVHNITLAMAKNFVYEWNAKNIVFKEGRNSSYFGQKEDNGRAIQLKLAKVDEDAFPPRIFVTPIDSAQWADPYNAWKGIKESEEINRMYTHSDAQEIKRSAKDEAAYQEWVEYMDTGSW